ncbi:Protein CBG15088 [Caenorhabditis briggsae]|uniref:Protein CBG15088 n=1 Tax=Caenorhabditis briggsae TaxID=6238 RepID=A8XLC9_CAEBR|nr:Protein CBG15088 [Caenorhabditis briggsae]CAP33454.2 Protein CBG15088 [Caenorhabditis briggsae]
MKNSGNNTGKLILLVLVILSFSYTKEKPTQNSSSEENKELYEIRFLDSFGFNPASLDCLSKNLDDDQCVISKRYYDSFGTISEISENEDTCQMIPSKNGVFELMRKKGINPYEYMDSFKKYEYTEIPSINKFDDSLNNKKCTEEEYLYAQQVWNEMKCQNLRDYTNIYMINDVLLLADVFENFRNLSMKEYGLDPCWYYTSPGLSWDAMLKKTEVKLETIADNEMYLFIEKGIRGGMVNAVKRYAKANNKYMSEYNPNDKSKYLLYLDANNLYGWAMNQKLPYGTFEFVEGIENLQTENKIKQFINRLNEQEKGCILEVDLEYPQAIHDQHNDFPLCPQNVKINRQNIAKLTNTLFDTQKYVIHYKNLLQALKYGLKLKKVHRILTFKESNWMASYIELNTNLRKTAKNDFEKDFFKLMNNSVFGKTMENVRGRVDIRLTMDANYIVRLASKPNFKRTIILNNELAAVEMSKTNVIFDKPIYADFSILELSKYLMYEFHYEVMQKRYGRTITEGNKIRLCYQDTDSLIYEIETENVYEDIKEIKEYFDFSDYPVEHPLYDTSNKKVIGKFKDELNSDIMTEIVALRPKQYAFKKEKGVETKKCKGIKKNIVKTLTTDDYTKFLFENGIVRKEQVLIRSKKHEIYTMKQNKVALNNENTEEFRQEYKRYIMKNNEVDTIAYGHYSMESSYRK